MHALSPLFTSHGLQQLYGKSHDIPVFQIKHETIRNNMFLYGLRPFFENTEFMVDTRIKAPWSGNFTMYGRSMAGICITHQNFYGNTSKLAGGLLHIRDDNSLDDDDDDDVNCHDSFLHGGVLECKRDQHALDQTAKEMFKAAAIY